MLSIQKGSGFMTVSYKRLFKLILAMILRKKDLKDMTEPIYGTIAKLEKDSNFKIVVLDKLYLNLNCQLDDII